jgi:hypothetical protein
MIHDGAAALVLAPTSDTQGRYGTLMQSFDAAPYVGHRVRFTLDIRTAGATGRRDFWARVQASIRRPTVQALVATA